MRPLGSKGFTLIELLVVVIIFALIGLALAVTFPPKEIIDKANDGKRISDINDIKKALEVYYQDHECYPMSSEFSQILTSHGEWSEGNSIYMKEVPLDPENYAYVYKTTEDEDCPQWMAVFAKLTEEPQRFDACPIVESSACAPQGIDSTWACATSGSADCDYLITTSIEQGSQYGPSATPGGSNPTSGVTPSISPTPSCTPNNWACTGNPLRCNVVPAGSGTYCDSDCAGAC